MKERSYRLGHYEIIVENNGGICWKAHRGFADRESGKCFIEGNVLFIGPGEETEPGFLKNEFLEYLRQFPQWDRTKYYCPSYMLHVCKGSRLGGSSATACQHRRWYNTAKVIHHSLSAVPGVKERNRARESERLPAESSTTRPTEMMALTSYPAAGIKHMKGKLGKALRRCRGLVRFNSKKNDSEG